MDNTNAVDHIDLMLDELKRIRALVPTGTEVAGICDRAITTTRQNVPVIAQRDRLEHKCAQVEREAERLTRERNAAQAIADPYVCDLLSNESSDDGGWRCIDEEPDGLLPEVCYAVGARLDRASARRWTPQVPLHRCRKGVLVKTPHTVRDAPHD